jgi:hypothetical protein
VVAGNLQQVGSCGQEVVGRGDTVVVDRASSTVSPAAGPWTTASVIAPLKPPPPQPLTRPRSYRGDNATTVGCHRPGDSDGVAGSGRRARVGRPGRRPPVRRRPAPFPGTRRSNDHRPRSWRGPMARPGTTRPEPAARRRALNCAELCVVMRAPSRPRDLRLREFPQPASTDLSGRRCSLLFVVSAAETAVASSRQVPLAWSHTLRRAHVAGVLVHHRIMRSPLAE